MKYLLVLIISIILYIAYDNKKSKDCEELSLAQYHKRQAMSIKYLSECGDSFNCLQSAIAFTDMLVKFDRQVRIHEGCKN